MPSDLWTPSAFDGLAFAGFRDLLDVFAQYRDWPALLDYETHWLTAVGVVTAKGLPLRLVAQQPKSRRAKPKERRALYDVSVFEGALPTRSRNWHDFFNVMMFAAFPLTKQRLHARHRDILERNLPAELVRLPGARTEEQDCLTILDEGGVVLATAPSAHDAIHRLLENGQHNELRELIDDGVVTPWLFGHAQLEHLAKHHAALRPPLPHANTAALPQLPHGKAVLLELDASAPRSTVDEALARCVSAPEFCSARDRRRPVSLHDLYRDLQRIG
ncbi:MAG TPA: DUF3025 domain-containing protein [Polyangiaceae bacterium]|nr:DUF3025 domain-containing protein [Polyangiaceae bacterium]